MATSNEIQVEQRQAPRLLYRDLKIVYDGIPNVVDSRSPDLSTSGMFINTPRSYPLGAQLQLRFDLLRTGIKVHALGSVRYCLADIGVGVQFVDLAENARAAIAKELEIIQNEEARS